ncbi:hypothetical protein ABFS83_02G127800 [Erythranthe nasuta]
MEYRHFSHNHGLVYHQVVQGSEIHCSGCKSAGSGNVYVCWQCNYFLHEHCFRSERSLKHPSHPLHPLTLMPFPTYASGSFSCDSCSLAGDGFSYSCSECEIDIHVHCALNIPITNPNPHSFHSPVPNPNPNPNPAQNYNPNIYPPPIQSNAYPTYPPQNTVYPPNPAQNYNPNIYPPPIQSNAYPTYPPQNTGYPPNPNNPYPNFTPSNAITPPIPIPQSPAYPPNQNNNPIPADPQPNIVPSYNYVPPPANPDTTVPPYKSCSELPKELQHNANPVRSHPAHTHALSLSEIVKPIEEEYSDEKTCSGCEQKLTAGEEAYTCPERDCEFSLHKSCFDLPEELQRNSHHDHKLNLLLEPPYYSIYYECSACDEKIKGFSFRCDECTRFRLHVKCAFLPETVDSKAHEHTLVVRHDTPQPADRSGVTCEVCERRIMEEYWSYFCKDCNFVTDLQCAFTADAPPVKKEEEKEEEEEEEEKEEEKEEETEEYPEGTTDAEKLMIATINAQNRMAMIQLQLQLSKNNSIAMANMFRY